MGLVGWWAKFQGFLQSVIKLKIFSYPKDNDSTMRYIVSNIIANRMKQKRAK